MSLVSDPAVFSVLDPRAKKVEAFDKKTTDLHVNAAAERSITKEVPRLAPMAPALPAMGDDAFGQQDKPKPQYLTHGNANS